MVSDSALTYASLEFNAAVWQAGVMRWPAVLTLLLATLPAGAADAVLPEYLPSETKVVFGIRMRNILDLLQSQSFAAEWRSASSQLTAQTPLAGFDPLKDLDEVLFTSSGEGDNPPVLLVLWGRFDVDRFASAAASYHGVPILEDAKKAGAIAMLDASTAIAGDAPLVRVAIDRRAGGAGIAASLAARIEPLRSHYSIWGVGDRPEHPPARAGQPDAMDTVDQFEVGAEVANGLELTAKIHVRSHEEAEKMASSIALAEGMWKGGQASPTGTKVEMHTEDGWLKLSVTVPQEALNRAIHEQRAALQAAVMSRLGVSISPQKPAPASGVKVVTDAHGDTLVVTLPGKR